MFSKRPDAGPPVIIERDQIVPVTTSVTINEHRAPTDESVKLLHELELAAEAKVVESVRVGDTTFECVVRCELDHLNHQIVYGAVFRLNGKHETAEVRVPRKSQDEITNLLVGAPWDRIRDAIARVIADRMICSVGLSSFGGTDGRRNTREDD